MKFSEYLNEESFKNYFDVLEYVKKNCMPYLKDWKKTGMWKNEFAGDALYSGRKGIGEFAVKDVRKNRRPKDIPVEIHSFFDEIFRDKFGEYLRSQSIFASSDSRNLGIYGDVYYIFPIGKYEIYWSPEVNDLYSDVVDSGGYFKGDELVSNRSRQGEASNNDFYSLMDSYKKGNLKGAMHSKNEIMLVCDKVVLISKKYKNEIFNMMDKL